MANASASSATTEYEGVAALKPNDALPGSGTVNEKGVDLVLGMSVSAGFFAGENDLGISRSPLKDGGIGEVVVDDDLGLLDDFAGAEGDEAEVAGTGAGEVADTFHSEIMNYEL